MATRAREFPIFVNHLFNIHFTINRNNNVTSMTINCLSSKYSSDKNIKFKDTYIKIINNRRVFYFKDIITFIHKHFKINNKTLLWTLLIKTITQI